MKCEKTTSSSSRLDGKLAGYLAATTALGAIAVRDAQAAVVANTAVQPFGINGEVNIDFNNDTQVDYQIDHDRVNLNGTDLDYLQIDKNDVNGASNPLDTDDFLSYTPAFWNETFPVNSSPHRNNDNAVLSFTNEFGDKGGYPVALKAGDVIGPGVDAVSGSVPGTNWDWQEGSDVYGSGGYGRLNRLIDEDHGQIDKSAGRALVSDNPTYANVPFGPQPEFPDLDDFVGLNGAVRYLGVRVDLNDAGYAGNGISTANGADDLDNAANYWYGWIGIRITNEADATGEVVGYAYETQLGMPIVAGDVGTPVSVPGDYNGDLIVNAADYTIWRDTLGSTTDLRADGDNTGASANVIDQADYNFWMTHFGNTLGSGSFAGGLAVPEPGSIVLAALGGGLLLSRFVWRMLFGRQ